MNSCAHSLIYCPDGVRNAPTGMAMPAANPWPRPALPANPGLAQSTMACSRCGLSVPWAWDLHWRSLRVLDAGDWEQVCTKENFTRDAYQVLSTAGDTWVALCDNCYNWRGGFRGAEQEESDLWEMKHFVSSLDQWRPPAIVPVVTTSSASSSKSCTPEGAFCR